MDGELSDDGLARPGRRGYQNPVASLERLARSNLEVIEAEWIEGGKRGQRRVTLALPLHGCCIPFSG
ncbi:unannotated protein [freshwater metagenome]|uniref:Unannotated protein n=1 Tax=freshwater metagenome TaxID=449393 RepID=A0A6J7EB34_9ZZZZ